MCKTSKILLWGVASLAVMASCAKESAEHRRVSSEIGEVRIALSQDPRMDSPGTKADGDLPSVEDFEVEIYNARAVRLYRQLYSQAKDETIRLNAGEFRLVAHHGDSLGAGFNKAYYLADTLFTVHGFVENGGEPDQVSAIARLGNVKMAVQFGDNIRSFYSDYYAIVRHDRYTKKSVRFNKNETREGFIPGGDLYLEIYAQLSGSGVQSGTAHDSVVYYKSPLRTYAPGDFVTFKVETGERFGNLGVEILVDSEVETVTQDIEIPASALPSEAPTFSHNGVVSDAYSYEFPIGIGKVVSDAALSFHSRSGIASVTLATQSDWLVGTQGLPASVSLLEATDEVKAAINAQGIQWVAPSGSTLGVIDFSGAVNPLSLNAAFDPAHPDCAVFTVTVTDQVGKTSTASFRLTATPVQSVVSAIDYNVWGWKVVAPVAQVTNADSVSPDANVVLQWSADGSSWSSGVAASSIEGSLIRFPDVTGLVAGTAYSFRTCFNGDPNNVSDPTVLTTETAQQVGNNGFEQYTEQTFSTKITLGSPKDVKWWQLYTGDPWWAVNSPVTLNTQCAAAYIDYKSYPTVAVFTDGAYAGSSVMVATVAIGDATSEIAYGDEHVGELFIGSANNANEGDWAKTSEGHAFGSRPSALSFRYKFNPQNSDAFYANIQVFATDNTLIAQATKQDITSSAGSWTLCTVPLSYTVTNKKAGSIKLSFKSSVGSENAHRAVTVNTLSGSHKIHAGNILYLDDVVLKYE